MDTLPKEKMPLYFLKNVGGGLILFLILSPVEQIAEYM